MRAEHEAGATTSGALRAHNRVRLLRAVHDCGASLTRSALTRDLGLARGTASVLVGELAESGLLHEEPAAEHGRGRPTQVPGPHPRGPIALAVDVREDAWEVAACELGGRATVVEVRPHDGTPEGALVPLGAALRARLERLAPRVVGTGVALAGPVRPGGLVDIAHLRWTSVDVPGLLALPGPLVVGNDTAFAGLAEARRGGLRGVAVGLHLHVDFDLGGTLIVDGRPLAGATGVGAEFGHMPLTGGDAPCMCGAYGCWGQEVGTNALLRHLGLAHGGGRGRDHAERLLSAATAGDEAAVRAVRSCAGALGRGVSALVNAHDPEAVTLSGFGVDLHRLALPELMERFERGLMAIRRERPPRIVPSALGWRGSLIGAMESVFDAFLTVDAVDQWRRAHA
ncbi:ROK family transcriptional regulator [Nonomuraea rhodomycinica]|uniref:ROK family transcriptional regulator n=1 Tax=Nonomuraea rhodomycinica TaxID=1712872 RepID=A0A7Y6IX19_9ACTN|nr:ROK family transcriptional regulator [Nonomuraea rhodomycinica]NUW45428.1 ROK family transcriptional regulator [Nonomuraea rhodomycinica]